MTGRYKKTIITLLKILHEAKKEPFENIQKWLTLQEALINKLIYVENRIRFCKKEIKEINKYRKDANIRLTKEESQKLKSNLKTLEYKIEDYRWIILILKSIGDGIAFTFIHKFDIKPQNFKESPGFISEKKGLVLEKKILRYSFKRGIVAILNDVTSVLKYADVTLLTDNGILPIEAKSSKVQNARTRRQIEKTNKLYKYLSEDVTSNLYGEGAEIMKRVEIGSHEINYIETFNILLASAKKNGIDFSKFEEGFLCLIAYNELRENIFDEVVKISGITKPIFFHLNMYKFLGYGYYPFSLIFNNPEHYWEFLEGNINVIIFIDQSYIEKISLENGYKVERAENEDWAFTFLNVNSESEIKEFSMSEHYFFRSFMEMVSVKWLIQDSFDRFKSYINEI